MKIISHNILSSEQPKIDALLEDDADIWVVPEMASPALITVPDGYAMDWFGSESQKKKGLGIIWKKEHTCEVPEWFNPEHKYVKPYLFDGKLLVLAFWPTKSENCAKMSYPKIAYEALKYYKTQLMNHDSVIVGDFNCFPGQSGESQSASMRMIWDFLVDKGFVSAYHKTRGELLGRETRKTFFMHRKETRGFFLDYVFTNRPFESYELYEFDKDYSDHVRQRIVL